MKGVKTMELLEAGTAVAVQQPDSSMALVIERLAANPEVDVAKLEKIIELQERIMRHQAQAAFNASFSAMQGDLPEITEKGQILVNGELRSTYATNEDIQRAVKPVLQRYGFSIRFRNEWLDGGKLKIIGILSHRDGHSEQDEFVAAADTSGSKNAIQALGSTRSYGQRYTTTALLNIATRGVDDDGRKSEDFKQPEPPKGYDEWKTDMTAAAENGWPTFSKAWKDSTPEYMQYSAKHDKADFKALRAKATKITAGAA